MTIRIVINHNQYNIISKIVSKYKVAFATATVVVIVIVIVAFSGVAVDTD